MSASLVGSEMCIRDSCICSLAGVLREPLVIGASPPLLPACSVHAQLKGMPLSHRCRKPRWTSPLAVGASPGEGCGRELPFPDLTNN
eukprot:13191112-Alexandrium_andersonii.AAC.1